MTPLILLLLALPAPDGCLVIDHGQITAGELGKRISAFRALPPSTTLALAPSFGVHRELPVPLLRQWAASNGLALPESIEPLCAYRRTIEVGDIQWEFEVREALDSLFRFQPGPDGLVIHDTQLSAGPPGTLSLDRSGLTYDARSGRYQWRAKINGNGHQTPARVTFAITRTEQRLITTRPLPAGRVLSVDDCAWQSFPVRPELAAIEKLNAIPEHQILRRSLPKGTVLLPQHMMDAPLIFAGDSVELLSRAGQATIRLQGIARGKARKGDSILISTSGNRLLRAIAVGPGRAEIESSTARKPN
jgi:flagella basal body P-ring formation protein FlgA